MGGTFLVSVSPLHDLQGRLIGSVHVARDITTQKRAEAEARKAVQQTETFLAMLSHELRNPLGAILNAAYIVKRAPAKHGSFQEALAVIERQAVQMSFLLDDLLDISRVMQGKIEMRHELVDLAEILQNAMNVVQAACDERGQRLEAQISCCTTCRARRSRPTAAGSRESADECLEVHSRRAVTSACRWHAMETTSWFVCGTTDVAFRQKSSRASLICSCKPTTVWIGRKAAWASV